MHVKISLFWNCLLSMFQENSKNQRSDSSQYSDADDDDLFTHAHVEILFGASANLDTIFDELDEDDSGYVSYYRKTSCRQLCFYEMGRLGQSKYIELQCIMSYVSKCLFDIVQISL